jgi:hypothetical protein
MNCCLSKNTCFSLSSDSCVCARVCVGASVRVSSYARAWTFARACACVRVRVCNETVICVDSGFETLQYEALPVKTRLTVCCRYQMFACDDKFALVFENRSVVRITFPETTAEIVT